MKPGTEYARKRRERLTAEGLCTRCGFRPARPGKKSCEWCAEREALTARKRREALHGPQKPHCSGKRTPQQCENCPFPECVAKPRERKKITQEQRDNLNSYRRRQYQQRKAAGLCTRCGLRPTRPGRISCAECGGKKNALSRERKHRAGIAIPRELMDGINLCTLCGKEPPIAEHKLCQKCYEIALKNMAKAKAAEREKNAFERDNSLFWASIASRVGKGA